MIRFTACAIVSCVAVLSLARADNPPSNTDNKFQLQVPKGDSPAVKDLAEIIKTANTTLRETKQDEINKVLAATAAKIVAHARKYSTDESTLDGLRSAIFLSMRSPEGAKTFDEAIEVMKTCLMKTSFAKTPAIRQHLRLLASGFSDAATELVRDVIKNHRDPLTRALAAKELIKALDNRVGIIKGMTANAEIRARYEKQMGKDKLQKLLDGVPQAMKEIETYRTALRTELKGQLPDREVGAVATETISLNLEGKTVKLSELKGKVVVLYFWSTSCVPCRALIPHTRELVKSMEGRPFVFVSISIDEEKETLTKFLRKEPMPWTHWWDSKRTVAEQWDLRLLSTLYVIDHKGVIQFKSEGYDPKSGKLEKKVEELVKIAESAR